MGEYLFSRERSSRLLLHCFCRIRSASFHLSDKAALPFDIRAVLRNLVYFNMLLLSLAAIFNLCGAFGHKQFFVHPMMMSYQYVWTIYYHIKTHTTENFDQLVKTIENGRHLLNTGTPREPWRIGYKSRFIILNCPNNKKWHSWQTWLPFCTRQTMWL